MIKTARAIIWNLTVFNNTLAEVNASNDKSLSRLADMQVENGTRIEGVTTLHMHVYHKHLLRKHLPLTLRMSLSL